LFVHHGTQKKEAMIYTTRQMKRHKEKKKKR
jgi:hypothetical protein